MEISSSYLAAYTADSAAQRPDGSQRGGESPAGRSLDSASPRPPAEQVLEGELLNNRRQQERASVDEQRQAAYQRRFEQMQQVKSASPLAARALAEYLTNADIGAVGSADYPSRLDVYA